MKKVLLTGASGFIGRHAINALVSRGYDVHAIQSQSRNIESTPCVRWHTSDIHDMHSISEIMHLVQPTHLLHLAWYAKPVDYWESHLNDVWKTSSLNMFKSFIAAGGTRAVFAGTCAEYDWTHEICNEDSTPCKPFSRYGTAKYDLYQHVSKLAEQNHISLAWGRIFFLFGKNEYKERLIPSAIQSFIQKRSFCVKSGKQIRDFMYVEDVADGLAALLTSGVQGPVNIASGKTISIAELILKISDKMHADQYVNFLDSDNDKYKILRPDVKKLNEQVCWQPKYSLDDAITKTIEWWSQQ